ncbi:glycosyltransferase family protein [Flavobacterium daemonense]|uniref:glycosyltransferase family 2 protein n=1 Tax=Flavobacterium daemonense TaxID=1393049 RepID=UPI001186743B|nr:glycosyltransferase family 2 protein [Flavobacterium daemonense]KAF2333116.1 glycosyltransferase family 2 protein [Flavobacterium daemonense]
MKNTYLYRRSRYFYSSLQIRIRVFYNTYIYAKFSKTVKTQLKDFKTIPIIIVNFNQLKNLQLLINYLLNNDYKNLHIIDNNSNYEPLLTYYNSIKNDVNVIFNKKNDGHMVFWEKDFFKKFSKGYYVVTDPDVIPIATCPPDFLKFFLDLLIKSKTRYKVGFSLAIDDIPDFNPVKNNILKWESKFWKTKTKEGHFLASIDTTFALYRPQLKSKKFFYLGLRTNYPYVAKHLGWYINPHNLSHEEEYYNKTASNSSSWKLDENGNIANGFY